LGTDYIPKEYRGVKVEIEDEFIEHERRLEQLQQWGWPPSLIKASEDEFEYAAFVEGIGVIWFSSVTPLNANWVHLKFENIEEKEPGRPFAFDRGVDVRLDAIKWVADAPNGS
jgi:hypothetical protein